MATVKFCDWDQEEVSAISFSIEEGELPELGLEGRKVFCCYKCICSFIDTVKESML